MGIAKGLKFFFSSMQIEGNLAQAQDAVMLDQDGFVSETNATNIVSVHSTYD